MAHLFGSCKDGDEDWPNTSLGKRLCSLEDNLRCKMCKEYYNNPQILPCGHSFCAICLSKRFDKKINPNATESCPQCREPVETTKVKGNRDIAEIIACYKAIRKDLHNVIVSEKKSVESKSDLQSIKKSKSVKEKSVSSRVFQSQTNIEKRIPLRSFHGESLKTVKDFLLDATKSVFHVIQMNCQGDKNTLEKRYRSFVHLHNAQVNSPEPLSLEQVIYQINLEESNKTLEANKSAESQAAIDSLKEGQIVPSIDKGFKSLIKKAKKLANAKSSSSSSSSTITSPPSSSPISTSYTTPLIPNYTSKSNENENQQIHQEQKSVNDMGNWKILMSESLKRPFYFNTVTKTGQFAMPEDLTTRMESSHEIVCTSQNDVESQTQLHHTDSFVHVDNSLTQTSFDDFPLNQSTFNDNRQESQDNDEEEEEERTQVIDICDEHENIMETDDEVMILSRKVVDKKMEKDSSVNKNSDKDGFSVDDVNIAQEEQEEEKGEKEENSQSDIVISMIQPTRPLSSNPSWVCEACTYINDNSLTSCEVCDYTNLTYLKTFAEEPTESLKPSYQPSLVFQQSSITPAKRTLSQSQSSFVPSISSSSSSSSSLSSSSSFSSSLRNRKLKRNKSS